MPCTSQPEVVWSEAERTLYVNGLPISVSVLAAIADPSKRLLWRFTHQEGKVKAVPFSEEHVLWLDKK